LLSAGSVVAGPALSAVKPFASPEGLRHEILALSDCLDKSRRRRRRAVGLSSPHRV